MPADFVPADRRVRFTRVKNVDTDRLQRRFAFMVENRDRIAYEADGRKRLREFAAEFLTIEAELVRRFTEG